MAENKNDGFSPEVKNLDRKANANMAGRIILYVSCVLVFPLIWMIVKRNYYVRQENEINQAISGIDVQLKKRRDTLIKLVDTVKGSVKFEKSLLTDVTKLRKGLSGDTVKDMDTTNQIASKINATFEAYPDLKTTTAMQKVMDASYEIEQEIAASRRLYNSNVNEWNQNIRVWPSSVVATGMGLSERKLFVASTVDKQDVKISFE